MGPCADQRGALEGFAVGNGVFATILSPAKITISKCSDHSKIFQTCGVMQMLLETRKHGAVVTFSWPQCVVRVLGVAGTLCPVYIIPSKDVRNQTCKRQACQACGVRRK